MFSDWNISRCNLQKYVRAEKPKSTIGINNVYFLDEASQEVDLLLSSDSYRRYGF